MLQVNGSVSKSIASTSGNLTLTEDHYTILITGNHSLTLPSASSCTGRIYVLKNKTTNTISISSYISANSSSSTSIGNRDIVILQIDGTNREQINN
jgi:tRNA(Phe) wybutosine-synthesizing methylase Tyw3